jgi:DUF1016 N-terminal domain
LFSAIKTLIETSKTNVAVLVNAEMTLLYWNIGKHINDEILKNKRAAYGKEIVISLALQLKKEFGSGWSDKQLRHCLRFAETFKDKTIVSTLRRQLSWTHIKSLIYIDDNLKRDFYIEMCKMDKWNTRTLESRINSLMYERTVISKMPEETIINEIEALKKDEK